MMAKVAGPAVLCTTPTFVLYGFYSRYPANRGMGTIIYLAIAFFDVWIAM